METPKPQLIFLWPYVEWGGAQIYCMAIMKLARQDWDITVLIPRSASLELVSMLEQLGVRVDYIRSAMDLKPAPTFALKLARQMARIRSEFESYNLLRRHDPDRAVLNIDFAPWQSWILYAMLSLRGYRVFFTFHNFMIGLPLWRELIFRLRMQIVSRLPNFHIVTANYDTRDKLRNWMPPKQWSKVPVIKACVDKAAIEAIDRECIDRRLLRNRFGIPEHDYVVLTVGQFIDRKGRWILLDAARQVIELDPGIMFVWVAPFLPGSEDMERISTFGLGERFRVMRSSEIGGRWDVLRFFKVADCFALPSYIEGLPISILEAMALGIPTIASNIFAVPEAVDHEETGLLIEPGDAEALSNSILRLRNDTALSAKLSLNGSKSVLSNFDERDAARNAVMMFSESLVTQ